MFIVKILTIIVSIAYFILLFSFIIGWKRIRIFRKGSLNPSPVFISVIIAARNEEGNITNTLESILKQNLDAKYYELIVVDDFSSDNTNKLIDDFCKRHANFHLISLNKHRGKKYALDLAIKYAKAELIVTTDADCVFQEEWLKTIKDFYLSSKAKMIIAPVLIKELKPFGQMQALDFLSLMASGAAATGINRAIMNNGANLAFSKKAYLSVEDSNNKKISSGDDVFLLLKFKELFPDNIHFLKSKKAIVYTQAKENFTEYMSQRKRWASKSKHYRDFDIIYTAFSVLSINSLLLFALIFSVVFTVLINLFLLLIILKSILDFIFLYQTSQFFQQQNLLKYFLPVQIANIFLIPFLAFTGLFTETKWKGETITK